jgi:hypothetical protein
MRALRVVAALALLGCAARVARPAAPTSTTTVDRLRREARALHPLVRTPWVHRFLDATAALPRVEPRVLYHDAGKTRYFTEAEADRLPGAERAALTRLPADEEFYYDTKYGSALAYCRALDLVGLDDVRGRKVLDIGYGTIGHLRLLATLGAEVVADDVDPLLPALYSRPGDQGRVGDGSVTLVSGHFPIDERVTSAVGGGYDLVISKNTLKRGYVHPEPPAGQPVDEKRHFDLGVDDEGYVRALWGLLKPGARAMIYNICPAPNGPGLPYRPWADGRSPFPRDVFEKVGFRVIAFDADDTAVAREVGRTLGWDKDDPPMDIEHDLFASYTLVERPQ